MTTAKDQLHVDDRDELTFTREEIIAARAADTVARFAVPGAHKMPASAPGSGS